MKKILTIIGARPQIIKAAAISRAIRDKFNHSLKEVIVHTGQHYDPMMSQVFFEEMQIPLPDENLMTGSQSHAGQTAQMMTGIESSLLREKPSAVLLYGDTNSTLAGALVAGKLHVPVIHVEAGLRSFNKSMPEEINRIVCDHVSTLMFSPTKTGMDNLAAEGFDISYRGKFCPDHPGIFHCGDVMCDNALYFGNHNERANQWLNDLVQDKPFILATIHRDHNTDNVENLSSIFQALLNIVEETGCEIVLPLHPRTNKAIDQNLSESLTSQVLSHQSIHLIPPVSYLQMIELEKRCKLVITDSGGVQKEAYFFQKPCVILRPETEWVELVQNGNALISGADEMRIVENSRKLLAEQSFTWPTIFGNGTAAEFICETMIQYL